MDCLPDELVALIAKHLQPQGDFDFTEQAALARLGQTNKRNLRIVRPLLLERPLLSRPEHIEQWGRACRRWITPFALNNRRRRAVWQPESVCFHFVQDDPSESPETWDNPPEPFDNRLPMKSFIAPCLDYGLFSHLTLLAMIDCRGVDLLPLILGPGKPLRHMLQSFTYRKNPQLDPYGHDEEEEGYSAPCPFSGKLTPAGFKFIFELSRYIDPGAYVASNRVATTSLRDAIRGSNRWSATDTDLRRAHLNWTFYQTLYFPDQGGFEYPRAYMPFMQTAPPTSHPFAHLRELSLRIQGSPSLVPLIFGIGAFPSLRQLAFSGALSLADRQAAENFVLLVRRSVTRPLSLPSGEVFPPRHVVENRRRANQPPSIVHDPDQDIWTPLDDLSKWEGPYRGPELEELDLEDVILYSP
ncbi:hypothetical protein JCM10207_005459 [Rhodosporidiobolus poonsookiae]